MISQENGTTPKENVILPSENTLTEEQKNQVNFLMKKANRLYHLCRYKEAYELYKEIEQITSQNGHVNYRLGVIYYDGHYVQQNQDIAKKYFVNALVQLQVSANEGDAESQCDLGYMYYCGRGTESDHNKALHFYKLASDQGHCRALNNLGHMYRDGHGTKRDWEMACKLYKLSCDKGYDRAQSSLAWMYLNGYGVPKDKKMAVLMYQLADYQGYDRARYSLEGIFKELVESDQKEYARLGPNYLAENWPCPHIHSLLKVHCRNAILELFCIFHHYKSDFPIEWLILIVKAVITAWPYDTYVTPHDGETVYI